MAVTDYRAHFPSARRIAGPLAVLAAALFVVVSADLFAAEKTITLRGRVDVVGLEVPAGGFTVRASQPQKRSNELGKTDSDGSGNFQLTVNDEAVGLYGAILEAASVSDPSLVLEAVVLRIADANAAIPINISTTVEAAVLGWKLRRHGEDLEPLRPFLLFEWVRPLSDPKTREGLKRAATALVKWSRSAAPRTTAAALQEAVGDLRGMKHRLAKLGLAKPAVAEIEKLARSDPEAAYLLMMPYFLDL